MTWLALVALLKRVGTAVMTWLQHASFWQIVSIGLAGLLVVTHFELVHERHVAATYLKQRDYYKSAIDDADKSVRDAQKVINQVSKELKDRTDEENRRIAGDANSLRVSGPGKAVCRPAPAASGGHEPTAPKTDAPVDPVLDGKGEPLIGVPFSGAVNGAAGHDWLLNRVKAWDAWYAKLVENWPKK